MLDQLRIFNLKKFKDDRGYFQETFNSLISKEIGAEFLQDNESLSKQGVIRGMHYQWDAPMGKLVRCSYGTIIDVVVDIREGSPDYGLPKYFTLSSFNSECLWVPPGFAHGFEVLSSEALVSYKCSSYYNKNGESGISPFDEDFNIKWMSTNPIVSEKDLNAKTFCEYNNEVKFRRN
jgi:dTDP-4-dehydrorhamnose 3,5-epimerase